MSPLINTCFCHCESEANLDELTRIFVLLITKIKTIKNVLDSYFLLNLHYRILLYLLCPE